MSARYTSESEHVAASEYDFLRKEVASSIEETRSLERTALAVTGGIWAWLFTHPGVNNLAWAIPPVLVVLAGFRARALGKSFGFIATYIQEREKDLFPTRTVDGNENVHGWETFRASKDAGVEADAKRFWVILCIGSIVGGVVAARSQRSSESAAALVKIECGVQPSQTKPPVP